MAFSKKYIGKGKQVENMDIVEVSLNMAELQNHTFEYEGETYVKFNVAKLKEPDQYGKTHTVYVSVKERESEESWLKSPSGLLFLKNDFSLIRSLSTCLILFSY